MPYKVTIRHEQKFAVYGPCWVARDESGTWRSYAKEHFASTAAEAVAAMFHADEIESVDGCGDFAVATINE
ncbi:hypothetical protein [Kordiimonas sp.]|uniref:hypothetical protein n=1 Tax=Kordiimonas sp. TaxID=1970157 RepID=UPI003A8FE0EF